jgi:hypothetical protein
VRDHGAATALGHKNYPGVAGTRVRMLSTAMRCRLPWHGLWCSGPEVRARWSVSMVDSREEEAKGETRC